MKTFIRGFLTTLLIVTFTLIPLVMYVEKTINEDLLGAYLEDTISDNLKENMKSEEVFDLTEEEQQALEEEFENNESLQEFVNKYKDQILKDINSSEVNKEDINFEEDVRQLLLDNKELIEKTTGKTLTDEEYEELIDKELEKENLNIAYEQIVSGAKQGLNEDEQQLLQGYQTLTSEEFIIIASIISVIAIIIIALLKKPYYKWIVNLSIAGIVSALLISLVASALALVINTVLTSNNLSYLVSATPMLITSGIMILVSIILLILNKVLDHTRSKKHAVS